MTARRPPAAVYVAGLTVTPRPGRVWIHQQGDGDMSPEAAEAFAVAVAAAAALAKRWPEGEDQFLTAPPGRQEGGDHERP